MHWQAVEQAAIKIFRKIIAGQYLLGREDGVEHRTAL